MKKKQMGIIGLALIFGLMVAGCSQPTGGGGFTASVNTDTANDAATLGLVGSNVTSDKTTVATAAIGNGKIQITSVAAGTATITVSDASQPPHTATIAVTVAADGTITIGTITKYGGGNGFTVSVNEDTANDEATLGLVGSNVTSDKTTVATAAIGNGKIQITSVAAGTATITVSDASQPPHTATIAVTVAANGTITIGTITKYGGGNGFTASVNEDTANDEATLGLVGTSVVSGDTGTATAAVANGKIEITSVAAGTTVVIVFDASQPPHTATIAVTVAADGTITIGTITKYESGTGFTPSTNNDTANDEATLGLVGTSAASGDTGIATAAVANGKIQITSVAAGTATITVSDASQPPHTATIVVIVTSNGAINIGTITKYESGTGFTPSTNNDTANDEATLGLVGTSVASGDTGVATAAVANGKIEITSVAAGMVTITVSDASQPPHTAAIAVTVAADGAITIGTITKYESGTGFTPSTNNDTANNAATLGLVGTSAASGDTGIATAAVANGKIQITSVAAGTATITVSDASQPPHTATIAVTVAADGAITIGTITKYEGGGGFTASADETTANDEATLGLVGTTVSSNDTSIAAVSITGGKIRITSVGAGNTTITVSDSSEPPHTATIAVTVAADGSLTLGTIIKYEDLPEEDPPEEELKADPLPTPANLKATALSTNTIKIEWDPVEGAAGYSIYFWWWWDDDDPDDGEWLWIDNCEETSYIDSSGLEPETEYSYAVFALDAQGNESGGDTIDEWVDVTTPAAPVPPEPDPEPEPDDPPAPELSPPEISSTTGIALTKNEQGITVTWSAVTNAVSYNVYRANTKNTADHTRLNTNPIPATMTAYDDMTVNLNSVGTSYYYVVTTVNVDGAEGAKSTPRGFTVTKPKVQGYNLSKSGDTALWGSEVTIGSTLFYAVGTNTYIMGLAVVARNRGHAYSTDWEEFSPGTFVLKTKYKYYKDGIKFSSWKSRPNITLKALHKYRVNVVSGAVATAVDLKID